MPSTTARFFRAIGLRSTKRSILMLVVTWTIGIAWLGFNFFWSIVPVQVFIAVPLLLLVYAVTALVAYAYWGVREVREKDTPYANIMIGVIVAITLLYFNYYLLQIVLILYRN
ncbi:hypothetical protein ACSX1A_19750 [Pontibacter sp. MBLB2868]|uniref:hypothetical protein n=1 Tax=Pontibacter sp. MBLB2868 TaxID=3451555 RepID=UPI003F754CB0